MKFSAKNPRLRKAAKRCASLSSDRKPKINNLIDQFTYCESSGAQANSKWHIRKLDERGRKLGGGIYSESLCKYLQPISGNGWGGWDLQTKITDQNLEIACEKCAEIYRELNG